MAASACVSEERERNQQHQEDQQHQEGVLSGCLCLCVCVDHQHAAALRQPAAAAVRAAVRREELSADPALSDRVVLARR